MKDLFLRALRCEEVERPPVWIMRQAGRYMPEYRILRQHHTLWQMFHEPEVAAQVTQLPMQLLGVDAAILFSDILVIAEAMGLSVDFPEKGGPRIVPAVLTPDQADALPILNVEDALGYVFKTIRIVKEKIDVPLIGFCGGPFTVATYMIDAGNEVPFGRTKKWIQEDPKSFARLLDKITTCSIAYLKGQVAAGAQVVQVFDSWANTLSDEEFRVFCLPYLEKIVRALDVPVILFCRDSSLRHLPLSLIKPAAISFDWHLPMKELRGSVPKEIAIQGNLEPDLLRRSEEEVVREARRLLESMKDERGFIVNLGHGVLPDTPFSNVKRFVDTVKEF